MDTKFEKKIKLVYRGRHKSGKGKNLPIGFKNGIENCMVKWFVKTTSGGLLYDMIIMITSK